MKLLKIHDWEIISETVTESTFENAMKVLNATKVVEKMNLPWQLCEDNRKHITTLKCKKTGKVKKIVTDL